VGRVVGGITPLREWRHHERRSRLIAAVATQTIRLTQERRWERILLSGSDRLTAELAAALPAGLQHVTTRDPRQLDQLEPPKLAKAVGDRLGEDDEARTLHLGRQIRDAALGAAAAR
jgi:hypothetical protein